MASCLRYTPLPAPLHTRVQPLGLWPPHYELGSPFHRGPHSAEPRPPRGGLPPLPGSRPSPWQHAGRLSALTLTFLRQRIFLGELCVALGDKSLGLKESPNAWLYFLSQLMALGESTDEVRQPFFPFRTLLQAS